MATTEKIKNAGEFAVSLLILAPKQLIVELLLI